jgi:hypothetical protein
MEAAEKLAEWYAMGPFGMLAVNTKTVNLDDLLFSMETPGCIVRVTGSPQDAIKLFPADTDPLGCIAGWISEDE